MGVVRRQDFSVANATTLNTQSAGVAPIGLPTIGHLEAISAEMSNLNAGPVWAILAVGNDISVSMTKCQGWLRGPNLFTNADGILWHGDESLEVGAPMSIYYGFRNDSGAAQQITLEWEVSELADNPATPRGRS